MLLIYSLELPPKEGDHYLLDWQESRYTQNVQYSTIHTELLCMVLCTLNMKLKQVKQRILQFVEQEVVKSSP